ncbi:MAG: serine O-acetyltransferase, partial [Pseudomonadota bacterium]
MSAQTELKPTQIDPVWDRMRREADAAVASEPLMASLIHAVILQARSLEAAISYRLAQKLATDDMPQMLIRQICNEAY